MAEKVFGQDYEKYMNDQIKNFGAIPSPKDDRDFTPEHLGKGVPVIIPTSWEPDISEVPVYMQSEQPSCGGHAGATLFGILGNLGTNLSPRFVYALCKKIDGFPGQAGTTGRAIMQVLQKYGVCTNDLFPNDTTLSEVEYADYTKIPPQAFVDALTRRIGAYAQVSDLSFQGIKNAVYQNKLVLVMAQIGNEWWTKPDGETSWAASDLFPLRTPNSVVSGHFFDDYAYNSSFIYFRNSWGNTWGIEGDGYYGSNYAPQIKEAWIAQLPTPPVSPPVPNPLTPQTQTTWYANILEWLANVIQWLKGRTLGSKISK